MLSFDAIQAIDPCVKAQCQDDCQMRAALGQWSSDMCDAVPAPRATDGGVSDTDAGVDGANRPATRDANRPTADAGAVQRPRRAVTAPPDDRAPGSPAADRASGGDAFSWRSSGAGAGVAPAPFADTRDASHRPAARARLPLDDVGDGLDQILGLDRLG